MALKFMMKEILNYLKTYKMEKETSISNIYIISIHPEWIVVFLL